MKPPFHWSGLERLSIYDRYLRRFEEKQIETVSSSTLAKAAGVYPAQL
ncbi:MAG: NADH/NAD ratio-sensing transcriptional regulator Rex [Paracoccaceae bacterium]